jgi:hypothetical protein
VPPFARAPEIRMPRASFPSFRNTVKVVAGAMSEMLSVD